MLSTRLHVDAGKRVWGLFEIVISFKKSLEMYETYGLLRRWNKGGEREGSRWIGEEKAWENQGKRGQKEVVCVNRLPASALV